jgi:hypothetical protein
MYSQIINLINTRTNEDNWEDIREVIEESSAGYGPIDEIENEQILNDILCRLEIAVGA